MQGCLLCARHASDVLSLWIMSGNSPPNLVCLYICLHFNDEENEVHSSWEQILFYQVKNQSFLLLPLFQWVLKCYLLLASASIFFFFFQVKCWMPKSPYSPALQTEMGWTGLLVYRAGPENTSAIRGRSVSRKKRSFWVSRVQWLPLCRGYSQLWTECAVISKAFWPRSSEAQVSWSHLRAASQERHLLQGEKSGLREMRDMPVSTQLDHDQVGNQNLRFLTPLFFLINSWIHLQNMTCVMIGSEEEHECKIWLWGIYLRLFCIWNPFLSIMWLDLRGSDGVESFRPLQVPVCARQWDISKSFLLD